MSTGGGSLTRNRRYAIAALVAAILLIGLLLRLYRLADQSLWPDETLTSRHLNAPDVRTFVRLCATIQPEQADFPLYYIIEYYWAHWIGMTPETLRLLPILMAVSAIPLLYLLGNYLHGTLAGLIAALCLALSPQHIWHAQEIRCYELVTPLVVLSIYGFLRGFRGNGLRWWLLNLLANGLLATTHMLTVFVPFIEGLFLLAVYRRRLRTVIRWSATQFVFLVPWFIGWYHMPVVNRLYTYGVTWKDFILNIIGCDIVSFHTDLLPAWKTGPPAPWLEPWIGFRGTLDVALLAALCCAAAIYVGRWAWLALKDRRPGQTLSSNGDVQNGLLMVLLLVVPGTMLGLIETFLNRIAMCPMYSMYNQIALYIMVGAAIAWLRFRPLRICAAVGVAALYGYQLFIFLPETTRTDWRSGAAHIRSDATPGDLVLNLVYFAPQSELRYYLADCPVTVRQLRTFQAACDDAVRFFESDATPSNSHVWLAFGSLYLRWVFPSFDPIETVKQNLAARGLQSGYQEFPGQYNLIVFRIERTPGIPPHNLGRPVPPPIPFDHGWVFALKQIDYKQVMAEVGLNALEPPARDRAEAALRESIDYWPIPLYPMSCHLLCLEPILDMVLRGHPEVAEAVARKSISENPKYGLLHFVLGAALAAQRNLPAASIEFRTAFAYHPGLDTFVGRFVSALCDEKDPAKACAQVDQLVYEGFFLAVPLYGAVRQAFPEYTGPLPEFGRGL